MSGDRSTYPFADDFPYGFNGADGSTSGATFPSFSDYLHGTVDYGQFTVDVSSTDDIRSLGGCAGATAMSVTPNYSSVSSSSTEAAGEEVKQQVQRKAEEAGKDPEEEDGADKSKKGNKSRKKGEKRQREPRFAFMTKSDVDHLEDGYRWRKYGQKAVKNSPYPRSYYRCTTQKCGVKKRVERSFQDPSIVITTYEGQHTHQSPTTTRGTSHMLPPPPSMSSSSFHQEMFMHQLPQLRAVNPNMFLPSPLQQQQQQLQYFHDCGLLQDIVPSFNTNQP